MNTMETLSGFIVSSMTLIIDIADKIAETSADLAVNWCFMDSVNCIFTSNNNLLIFYKNNYTKHSIEWLFFFF